MYLRRGMDGLDDELLFWVSVMNLVSFVIRCLMPYPFMKIRKSGEARLTCCRKVFEVKGRKVNFVVWKVNQTEDQIMVGVCSKLGGRRRGNGVNIEQFRTFCLNFESYTHASLDGFISVILLFRRILNPLEHILIYCLGIHRSRVLFSYFEAPRPISWYE